MSKRIQWADIVKATRETSEELAGKDWVNAGTKARVLLADLADEHEHLKAENAALAAEVKRLRREAEEADKVLADLSREETARRNRERLSEIHGHLDKPDPVADRLCASTGVPPSAVSAECSPFSEQVAALHADMTRGGRTCDRCGGSMIHTRLKGYRCPKCD